MKLWCTIIFTTFFCLSKILYSRRAHHCFAKLWSWPCRYSDIEVLIQWGIVKPWSVESKDHYPGLNGLWFRFNPTFEPFCHRLLYPYFRPHHIRCTSNFSRVYLSRLHWIYRSRNFLNVHSFQASSHQYLQI